MKEPVYEVFARKTRDEALRHIGYVNAMDDELARVYAWNTYDEQNWFEMCIVARTAILPVNQCEGPFAAQISTAVGDFVHAETTGSYGGSDLATEVVP